MINRVGGPALLGAAVVVSVWLGWSRTPASGQPEPLPAPKPAGPKYLGVASCASMACHHFNGPQGTPRSEYSTWAGHDQHTKAYAALENERSLRIVRNLYGDKKVKATETELCLKCHATYEANMVKGERFYIGDGVGCEACHGPAGSYIDTHYLAGFKELSPEEKERRGLWDVTDLSKRTQRCASCHVGDASREVNHDLIAAGHPRLNFEMGGYHGIYAKHWQHADDVARHPDFEARLWLIGQLTTARDSIELLAVRAESADKQGPEARPWPEFAEYACYACHKDLRVDKQGTPRQRARFGGQYPGSLPWGTWYLTMLGPLDQELGGKGQLGGPEGLINNIRRLMQHPSPDSVAVAAKAREGVKKLDALLAQVKARPVLRPEEMRRYALDFLKVTKPQADAMIWDEASQIYLAAAAMNNALSDLGQRTPPARLKAFVNLKTNLRKAFPPGYDSPQNFNPLKPSLFEQLQQLRGQFGN